MFVMDLPSSKYTRDKYVKREMEKQLSKETNSEREDKSEWQDLLF